MTKILESTRASSSAPIDDRGPRVGLLGVPFDNAVSWRPGPRFAPERIRGLMPRLARITEEGVPLTLPIDDHGDVPPDLEWARHFADAEARALAVLRASDFSVFLGGDHSVGIPLVKAFSRRFPGEIGYIQFDAHPDLADEYDGHRWSHACAARRHLELPNLTHRRLAFAGLRSHMVDELEYYKQHPEIGWHTAREIHLRGIEAVAHDVVAQLRGVDAVYMSVDIDGIDPMCCPGTGTPVHGGPTVRECLEFLRIVFAGLPVRALDIVEVSPPLDVADVTSMAAVKLIYESIGFFQHAHAARSTSGRITDASRTPRRTDDASPTTGSIADASPTTGSIDDASPTTGSIADASPTTGSIADEPTTGFIDDEPTSGFIDDDEPAAPAIVLDRDDELAGAPLIAGSRLPWLVQPQRGAPELGAWAEPRRAAIQRALARHGAVLLRGFSLAEPSFARCMAACTTTLLDYTYRSTPRTAVGDRVYTATEYPARLKIPLHNENAYQRVWPRTLGFHCVTAASVGGETPLADMVRVTARIPAATRARFARHGVLYVRNYGAGVDLPWPVVFQTASRAEAERWCHAHAITCEWRPGDRLRTRQVCQAEAVHPVTGERVWFNQAHLFHASSLEPDVRRDLLSLLGADELPRGAFLGDGAPIEADDLAAIRAAFAAEAVEFAWQSGDVLLVDNMQAAHGRNPYTGPRALRVMLADPWPLTDRD